MPPESGSGPAPLRTLGDFLDWGAGELSILGESEAKASAEALLSHVTGFSRSRLYLERRMALAPGDRDVFCSFIRQRKQRVPVAYITGRVWFCEETLEVTPGCLIPRPETEELVAYFIEHSGWSRNGMYRFADIGSGSGAIGISLLRYYPEARAVLVDIEARAAAITRSNLLRSSFSLRGYVIRADLFGGLPADGRWDALISNPPYLARCDWESVEPEVLQEPRTALDGGEDGMDYYRRLVREAPVYLRDGGWLVLEAGQGQAPEIRKLFMKSGWDPVRVFPDHQHIERVIMARWYG